MRGERVLASMLITNSELPNKINWLSASIGASYYNPERLPVTSSGYSCYDSPIAGRDLRPKPYQDIKPYCMFNKDALEQLSSLKSSLSAQKTLKSGRVRTTLRRFAFVKLDDGQEAFLPPDETLRVLPGDRVQVNLVTNAKKQLEAQLEQLESSELTEMVGRYRIKGKAHFVEPDLPQFSRWLFIPPQERKPLADGDYVQCRMSQHPFKHQGRAQVKNLSPLGKPEEPGLEARYVTAKFQLATDWSDKAQDQTQAINLTPIVEAPEQQDLTHLGFVTIDAENTRDMDDAVYLEPRDDGWELMVAIADPSRYIQPETPLDKAARERASTVYLLGQTLTMLPAQLSHDTFSLVPEQRRPVLLCRMHIDAQGDIRDYCFTEALIRSRQKLSYKGVAQLLAGETPDEAIAPELIPMLEQLHQCAQVRGEHRRTHALVMEDRPDYYFILNENKKIARIEKRQRNVAHRIVEEAMLAANICAGRLLSEHPGRGIFSNHVGFRPERLKEALSLLQEDLPDYPVGDLQQLDDFQRLMRDLRQNAQEKPEFAGVLSLLQRMLQAASLSSEASEHFGLGFAHYATITSPIRRYHDFYNHRAIKTILREQDVEPVGPELLVQLQSGLQRGRQACREQEQWLACEFVSDKIGSVHSGKVVLVNSVGLGVRLDDWGIEGFVRLDSKDKANKPKFDAQRLTLKLEEQRYRIDQEVNVIIHSVDKDNRRIALELVDEATAERLRVWTDPQN